MKERTLASYNSNKIRLQLVQLIIPDIGSDGFETDSTSIKYQIRKNRRILNTSDDEYQTRKYFASLIQNNVLQLKIY